MRGNETERHTESVTILYDFFPFAGKKLILRWELKTSFEFRGISIAVHKICRLCELPGTVTM